MDHPEGDRGEHLDDEVAVADGVERVRGHALEPELLRRRLAIERIAGAGERAGAQRGDVEPPSRVGQPSPVALDHLDIGEQVVGEQHGLGRLDVGRAGQDGVALALGEADQRALEGEMRRIEAIDRPARPEPQVRGDLVVARTAGVEPAGDRPDPLGERGLEVQVDVLERRVPLEPTGRHVLGERGQPGRRAPRPGRRSAGPARPRPRTWAIEPARSSAASSRSTSIERVNASTRASLASLNRPPQSRMVPPSGVPPC